MSLDDGHGAEGVGVGTQQTADGQNVSELTPPVVTPQAIDPASGANLNFGADDNLDSGEHDSSAVIGDGPSDGGAVVLATDARGRARPGSTAFLDGDTGYLLSHPVPVLDGGGRVLRRRHLRVGAAPSRRVAYQGGDPRTERDVADYAGQAWDPETCAGPSDTVADCGHDGIAFWHHASPTTYVEPGMQVYEDPNPEGSPIGPYPLPALAVTTCGVFIGGGQLQVPASPLTNSAGQLAIHTAC